MMWQLIRNVKLFLEKCKKDNINAYAAQTAFFVILSFIPFIMVFSSLLQYTPVSEVVLLNGINEMMPDYISPFIISVVDEVYNSSMGVISVSAVVAIWSAAKGVQYLSNGLNAVNQLEETRNWLVLRARAALYTFAFLIAIVVVMVLLVFGNSVQNILTQYSPVLRDFNQAIHPFRFFVILFILMLLFAIAYKALPNTRPSFLSQIPGAVICACAWYIFSFGLSIYVKYFNGFSMYGSLTTIVLLMLWLYFCMYIYLLCAEINYLYGNYFHAWWHRKKQEKKQRK